MISATTNFLVANAALEKKPILTITVGGSYPRSFATNADGSNVNVLAIESFDDLSQTINDMDGGADLGELRFTVSDRGGLITSDFPTFTFEGKSVVLKAGFVGLSSGDFVTLFTGVIDTVSSANDNASYAFRCIDNKQSLSKVIYTVADDGKATDSDHRKTINAHPLDVLIDILENQVGYPSSQINIQKIATYRDTIFAGLQFVFSIDSPPSAKDFIENQIMKPLGGYIWVNNLGQVDVNFFYPNDRMAVSQGCLLGCFVDGSGTIVTAPFPIGLSTTIEVPPGAVNLSMGCNDGFYTDNIGEWWMDVSGTTVHVSSANRPWNIAANPTLTYTDVGSTSPATIGVTPGATITITYLSHTVQIGVGFPFTDSNGIVGMVNDPQAPGKYAYGTQPLNLALAITHDTIVDQGIPLAEQADLVNQVLFRFDKDTEGKFHSEPTYNFDTSTTKYAQFVPTTIESDGMRSGFQAFFHAALISRLIFYRYGLKNLTFVDVPLFWDAVLLEPGDFVSLTSPLIPDRELGVKGITGKMFEILDRTWNLNEHTVTVTLLDASYLSRFAQYLIAPNSTPAFTSASAYAKARYLFLSNTSDQYSDTTPGHTLG